MRIKRPIAISQQIMPGHRVQPFAVKTQQAEQAVECRAMAIRGVSDGGRLEALVDGV
ncbi:hypothetical protein D3C75_878890 [compost metagenome]